MRLVIHRDGQVLTREYGEPDRAVDKDDPFALAQSFRALVELEEGLTCAQLFRALRPWALLLSRAAWIDFDSWQASATRAPLQLVTEEPGTAANKEPPLSAVIIHPILSVHPRESDRDAGTTINIHWRTSGRYASPRPNGFGGEDLFCSLSFAPPQRWAQLPLLIDPALMVDDCELLREASPTIRATEQGRLMASPTFFEAMVLGFFDDISFHGTPQEAAEAGDELARRVAEISSRAEDEPL